MLLSSLFKQLWRKRGGDRQAPALPGSESANAATLEAVRHFESGEFTKAQDQAAAAVKRDPRCHPAWNLLGAIAAANGMNEMAIRHFERAIAIEPANADYLSNCGEACRRAGWLDDAVANCRTALTANPGHLGARYNLALALHAMGEVESARDVLVTALAISPDDRRSHTALLFLLCHHPDIEGATLLAEHRNWNERHARNLVPNRARSTTAFNPDRKLRIGYVSGDFRRHSLSYFIEPLFANHDRLRFEVFCYSNTRKTDDVTDQLRSQVSQWRDIRTLSDEAAAALVMQDGIDILIDLSGHTADSRLLMFARKPAPVQMSYLGYPNTTGLTAMDFRVTDAYMDPLVLAEPLYVEKLLRMPHSLWCYRPPADAPEVNPLPALIGNRMTFGSLHSFTKLNRAVIQTWAKILASLPDADLVIAGAPEGETRSRLTGQFAAHGVEPDRIQLVGKQNFDDYLKLYHRIDIGLDAFPYNGGTTTCESLWMGVPVITLAGAYGVARAGVSLLTTADLPELIAPTRERYVEIAVNLARDPRRLAALRSGLRERMQQSPLMNETAFTRAFEAMLHDAMNGVRQ